MTQIEWLMLALGFSMGCIFSTVYFSFPMKRLRRQVYKLRGQVYYWSRQMPVAKKRGRPAKVHNCIQK